MSKPKGVNRQILAWMRGRRRVSLPHGKGLQSAIDPTEYAETIEAHSMLLLRQISARTPKLSFLPSFLMLFTGIFLLASPAMPQSAANADYVVIKPVVNMYSKASVDSDVVSQAIYATNVVRLEGRHDWVRVRTADDYTGWMQLSILRKLKGQAYAASGPVARVTQLSANIYREPDVTKHAPLLTIPWESRMEIVPGKVEDGDEWLQVRLPNGSNGFVQTGDVSSDFTPLTIDQTIAVAKKFLGVTYTWGGSSDFGFDCSGFMQMLMRQRGIIMPRDADLQAAWKGVTPVERKDLQPGDLLYFGDRADHITHTGMYIGNGQFIHDTTHEHPGVQISVLDDQPWTTLLVAARRAK
jgi:gamma-D-glutamyl-L-lysine dipeptidyl-peptidase